MKRLMMTVAALALLTNAAAANPSLADRDVMGWVPALVTLNSALAYTYDKHCETVSKEFADENIVKGLLDFDPAITAESMKYVDDTYRKMGKEEFCKLAKEQIESWNKKSQQ